MLRMIMVATLALAGCQKGKKEEQASAKAQPSETEKAAPPLKDGEEVIKDCGHAEDGAQCDHKNEAGGTEIAAGVWLYGKALPEDDPIPLATVLAEPDAYVGKTLTMGGHVRAACTKKGCWMEVAESAEKSGQGARVVFRDYGFFVPTDSAGSEAVLHGEVKLSRVVPAQVAHYEAEGATFAKKYPDGSAREIRIVATGVQLTRATSVTDKKAAAATKEKIDATKKLEMKTSGTGPGYGASKAPGELTKTLKNGSLKVPAADSKATLGTAVIRKDDTAKKPAKPLSN